jgi:hypothetical protein
MVAPKGERLQNRIGGHGLKLHLMGFAFLSSFILCMDLQHTHDLDSLDRLSLCFLLLPLELVD